MMLHIHEHGFMRSPPARLELSSCGDNLPARRMKLPGDFRRGLSTSNINGSLLEYETTQARFEWSGTLYLSFSRP